MELRGMGERRAHTQFYSIERPKMASDLFGDGKYIEANHALVWTSMIAVRAGLADAWELLNDRGLLHEVAHVMHAQVNSRTDPDLVKHLLSRISAFERKIPGVHPCWAGDDVSSAVEWRFVEAEIEAYRAKMLAQLAPAMTRLGEAANRALLSVSPMQAVVSTLPSRNIGKPGSREFAMNSVARGRDAKAAMVAKLKARAAKPKPTPKALPTPEAPSRTVRKTGTFTAEFSDLFKAVIFDQIARATLTKPYASLTGYAPASRQFPAPARLAVDLAREGGENELIEVTHMASTRREFVVGRKHYGPVGLVDDRLTYLDGI
jgi:hypothetical protein